jgi:hypothetical protein
MDDEGARLATAVLGLLMLLGACVFTALYWRLARWHKTALGRHMLYFMLALIALLIVRSLRFFWPDVGALVYIGLATYGLFAAVIWQRVFLLVRSLRREGED